MDIRTIINKLETISESSFDDAVSAGLRNAFGPTDREREFDVDKYRKCLNILFDNFKSQHVDNKFIGEYLRAHPEMMPYGPKLANLNGGLRRGTGEWKREDDLTDSEVKSGTINYIDSLVNSDSSSQFAKKLLLIKKILQS